jgi:anti-sigma B factor antagonist
MLNIDKTIAEDSQIRLSGRLDTTTAPELETVVDEVLENGQSLTLDMEELEYISSAGLRVILKAQKGMSRKGGMKLVHVPEAVMEVFSITGFSDFLTIEG